MGDPKGFLKIKREKTKYRPVEERKKDFKEVALLRPIEKATEQASRCMDCGTPFCHWACPVGNYIPEWNDALYKKEYRKAYELLKATNNLPEITGRLCPALCEYSCVLGINDDPVTIRENELNIIEYAFSQGWVKAEPPVKRTGKKVAVIGSGPAGLACADQLNKAGHTVIVYEKADKVGGFLRYGIPEFKLEKHILDRRIKIYEEEGIIFKTNTEAGKDIDVKELLKEFDAICLTAGSRKPRDLAIPGRELEGIYFAVEYLTQANMRVSGKDIANFIDAKDKDVIIIGGGDTGADCVGTAVRQGARSIRQIEIMPKPPESRTEDFPWPKYPMILRTSTSHEEGGERDWSILTKRFEGEEKVEKLICARVKFEKDPQTNRPVMKEIEGSEFTLKADLVILALGFLHPEHEGLISGLGVELDERGNVKTDGYYKTNIDKVFAAGDLRRGQSLIVWAISEGRKAAENIDKFLRKA
ncbi:MAG: glutamate synthase subunit beta [Brevinematia bacterium]